MFGVSVPKSALKEFGASEELELEVRQGQLVIGRPKRPRQGWAESFRLMHERGDDKLVLIGMRTGSSWDETEWEW